MTILLDEAGVETQYQRWLRAIERFEKDVPVWGYHARRLRLTMCRGWNHTAAVDGVHLFWNPEFTQKQNEKQLLFMLFHEVFHVAAGHIWRGQRYYTGLKGVEFHRVVERWGEAIDYSIHQLAVPLIDRGHYQRMEFIPCGLYDARFTGMGAEEIYNDLLANPVDRPQGSGVIDIHILRGDEDAPEGATEGPDGSWVLIVDQDGNPVTPDEDDPRPVPISSTRLRDLIRGELDDLSGDDARTVDTSGPVSSTPWKEILQRFVVGHARGDYSYARPNRAYLSRGMVVPGLYAPRVLIKFAVDFSISMDEGRLDQCGAEIEAARQQIGEHELELIPCNDSIPKDRITKVEKTQVVTTGQPLDWQITPRGGTDFCPVFDYLDRKGEEVTCLVYFTDCEGDYPTEPPPYPVLWARCPGGCITPPWGEVINLD